MAITLPIAVASTVSVHQTERIKARITLRMAINFLSWAFAETAITTKRFCPEANRYWQRKNSKTSKMVAYKSLASKVLKGLGLYNARWNCILDKKTIWI